MTTDNRAKAERIAEEYGRWEGRDTKALTDAIEAALKEAVAEQEIYLTRSRAERNVLLDVQKDLKCQLAEQTAILKELQKRGIVIWDSSGSRKSRTGGEE